MISPVLIGEFVKMDKSTTVHIAHHTGGQRAVITLEDECWPSFYIMALDFIFGSPLLVLATFFNRNQGHNVKLRSLRNKQPQVLSRHACHGRDESYTAFLKKKYHTFCGKPCTYIVFHKITPQYISIFLFFSSNIDIRPVYSWSSREASPCTQKSRRKGGLKDWTSRRKSGIHGVTSRRKGGQHGVTSRRKGGLQGGNFKEKGWSSRG